MNEVPSEAEIENAVGALFTATRDKDRKCRWNALVPTRRDIRLPAGLEHLVVVDHTPAAKSRQVLGLRRDVDVILGDSRTTDETAVRMALVGYCLLMEWKLGVQLILNQLLVLLDEPPEWDPCLDLERTYRRIEKNAGRGKQPIGAVVTRLWRRELRNAVMHSDYLITTNGTVRVDAGATLKRGQTSKRGAVISRDEVSALYGAASTLVGAIASNHTAAYQEATRGAPAMGDGGDQ